MSFSVQKLLIFALCRTLIACELNLLSDPTTLTPYRVLNGSFLRISEIQTPAIRIFTRKFCFAMHQVRAIILKEAYDQFYSVKIFFDGHLDSMEYPMPPPPLKGGAPLLLL